VHDSAYTIPSRATNEVLSRLKKKESLKIKLLTWFSGRVGNICEGAEFTALGEARRDFPWRLSIICSPEMSFRRLWKKISWRVLSPFWISAANKRSVCPRASPRAETGEFIQRLLEHDVRCWYGLVNYILRWLKALFARITALCLSAEKMIYLHFFSSRALRFVPPPPASRQSLIYSLVKFSPKFTVYSFPLPCHEGATHQTAQTFKPLPVGKGRGGWKQTEEGALKTLEVLGINNHISMHPRCRKSTIWDGPWICITI